MQAWRKACRFAERIPRYTPGEISLADYRVRYVDLLTLCPQWHDIFVREINRVTLSSKRPTILDCGANVGLATLYFKRLFPGATITAFEADPAIFDALQENMRANGAPDVELVRAAVWRQEGEVRFVREGSDSGALEQIAGVLAGDIASVPAIRLRDVLSSREFDVLKLDIEGAEEEVLADCADVLANVRVIIAEVHEFGDRRLRTTRVLDVLEKAGFTVSMDSLTPLPWREPRAAEHTPFPGIHLCWTSLVRAFRK